MQHTFVGYLYILMLKRNALAIYFTLVFWLLGSLKVAPVPFSIKPQPRAWGRAMHWFHFGWPNCKLAHWRVHSWPRPTHPFSPSARQSLRWVFWQPAEIAWQAIRNCQKNNQKENEKRKAKRRPKCLTPRNATHKFLCQFGCHQCQADFTSFFSFKSTVAARAKELPSLFKCNKSCVQHGSIGRAAVHPCHLTA